MFQRKVFAMGWRLNWLLVSFALQFFAFPLLAKDVVFAKKHIMVAGKKLVVEVAESNEQHQRGLMERRSLGDNQGMLFVFSDENYQNFWMKNTFIPLSIGFFDAQRKLVDIQDMEPVKSVLEIPKSYQSKQLAKYALEVPQGWFLRNKIKINSRFDFVDKSSSSDSKTVPKNKN